MQWSSEVVLSSVSLCGFREYSLNPRIFHQAEDRTPRPQHNVSDIQCRLLVFDICEIIAQSEQGRKALIDRKVLQMLSRLAVDNSAQNVIGACKILKTLALSGTFRSALLSAGIKEDMERITRYVFPS
jgi:hypothetical protein